MKILRLEDLKIEKETFLILESWNLKILESCFSLKEMPEHSDFIAILDFGSQYNQLIARRVRECRVYCELLPYTTPLSKILERSPKGIILSGGPASVYEKKAPVVPKSFFSPSHKSVV